MLQLEKGQEIACRVFRSKRLMYEAFRFLEFGGVYIFRNCVGVFYANVFEVWFCSNHSVEAWVRRDGLSTVVNSVVHSTGLRKAEADEYTYLRDGVIVLPCNHRVTVCQGVVCWYRRPQHPGEPPKSADVVECDLDPTSPVRQDAEEALCGVGVRDIVLHVSRTCVPDERGVYAT